MAKIGLTEGFSVIPEGTYVFKIVSVAYKEDFGKLSITMQTKTGAKHIERFSLLKNDGSPNDGALSAFSYFAKTAMNDFTITEIDHEDLVGHFVECDVVHDVQENKNKPGQTVTFERLAEKRPAAGWDVDKKTAEVVKKESIDLKSLLG